MKFLAPTRICGPLGAEVSIPYEVVGVRDVLIDPVDPYHPAWIAGPQGVIRALIADEPTVFRLEGSGDGQWGRHSIIVESWDHPWLGVEGTRFPAFRRGIHELPRLRRTDGRRSCSETVSGLDWGELSHHHVASAIPLVLIAEAM